MSRLVRLEFLLISFLIDPLQCSVSAAEDVKVMTHTRILGRDSGHLTIADGEIRFRRVGPRGRTLWTIEQRKEGLSIYYGKALLGIDPEKKELILFDKPGPTTTWTAKQVDGETIRPSKAFRALLVMNVKGEELRLAADDEGKPVLGGKADIIEFYISGL